MPEQTDNTANVTNTTNRRTMQAARRVKQTKQTLPLFTTPIRSLIQLDRTDSVPLYQQICHALREAILSGEIAEGTRLPTERALARELDVNRTTVMNAYNELASEGLIEGHVGRGTLVRRSCRREVDEAYETDYPTWLFGLAEGENALLGPDARVLGEIAAMGERKEIISFASGTPASDMLPAETLRNVVDSGLEEARQQALGYCPVEGLQSLRRGIAARMRTRGVAIDLQHVLILSGSTQGIGLIARFLLHQGDEVVVEIPTYLGAINTFRALGAKVIGVPMDNDGMRVDLLESILARRQPRFIYTSPTFHNPTGTVLSPERRRRLLTLAHRYQIPIVEDDAYGEIYFEGKQVQPLKAMDRYEQVLYLSTYSKVLAPGLRVAWLVAPSAMIERLSLHKQVFDLNTNALGQWMVSEILQHHLLDPHLAMIRQRYQHKRDLMLEAIQQEWPSGTRVNHPLGGFHLWCRLPTDMRARTLLREATAERVAFVIGEPFHIDGGGHQYIRLSYASAEEDTIIEGIHRIGNAMRRIQERRSSRDESSQLERLPMV